MLLVGTRSKLSHLGDVEPLTLYGSNVVFHCAKLDLYGPLILEREPLRFCKCFVNVTFTIPFQDIYLSIKGDLAQHQVRSCKGDLSITFTMP